MVKPPFRKTALDVTPFSFTCCNHLGQPHLAPEQNTLGSEPIKFGNISALENIF